MTNSSIRQTSHFTSTNQKKRKKKQALETVITTLPKKKYISKRHKVSSLFMKITNPYSSSTTLEIKSKYNNLFLHSPCFHLPTCPTKKKKRINK